MVYFFPQKKTKRWESKVLIKDKQAWTFSYKHNEFEMHKFYSTYMMGKIIRMFKVIEIKGTSEYNCLLLI